MSYISLTFQEETFGARKIKKNYPEKIFYIPGKWRFLALTLKNFLHFLIFQETKTLKKFYPKETFLIFRETETPKKFSIFQETERSYTSGNGNPKTLLIVKEVIFRSRKMKKKTFLKRFLCFGNRPF